MSEDRQLSAIMFTDIVGYTSLMGEDEQKGLAVIEKKQRLILPILEKFNGEKLKDLGDGTLSSFRSAVDAVNCAIQIQRKNLRNTNFSIRIGIHIGDVVFRDGDIFGDGVNVASRIEPLAEPGGVCVSGSVYENIRNQPGIESIYLGEQELKNVSEPIKVYALTADGLPELTFSKSIPDKPFKLNPRRLVPLALFVVVCGVVLLMLYRRQPPPEIITQAPIPSVEAPIQDHSITTKEVTAEDRARNANEIVRLELELEALSSKITQMNSSLVEIPQNQETDITAFSSLIEDKDNKQRQLNDLKQIRTTIIVNDILAYQKIVESLSGSDLPAAAWNKLISNYPEAAGLPIGDIVRINLLLLKEWTEPFSGIEFVYIEEACFQMGDNSGVGAEDEQPGHEVCLDSFGMSKYEVTQGQWQKIMGSNPSKFTKGEDYPVEQVSWFDTQDFMRKLNTHHRSNFRLPTEAEWEYGACGGNSAQKYAGGNNLEILGWYNDNSQDSTHPVGTKEANDFGLFDMSGNVWEWCSDWYGADYYQNSLRDNPIGPSSGSFKVIRDGCWNGSAWLSRCTNRNGFKPAYSLDNLGFRVALLIN